MKVKEGYVLKKVLDDYVAVPFGKAAVDFDGMITMNGTGAFLWEQLQQEVTEKDLTKALLEKYEVTEEHAAASVRDFLKKLEKEGFLV